jgi:hypothetical protein
MRRARTKTDEFGKVFRLAWESGARQHAATELGDAMTPEPRLRALADRHATLEKRIDAEGARPLPDHVAMQRLKLEKLRVKEEMERLRQRP